MAADNIVRSTGCCAYCHAHPGTPHYQGCFRYRLSPKENNMDAAVIKDEEAINRITDRYLEAKGPIFAPELAQMLGMSAMSIQGAPLRLLAWLPPWELVTPDLGKDPNGKPRMAWPRKETMEAVSRGRPRHPGPAGRVQLLGCPRVFVDVIRGKAGYYPTTVTFYAGSPLLLDLDAVETAIMQQFGMVRVIDSQVLAPGTYPLITPEGL